MRSCLLAATAIALSCASAVAADLPTRRAPPVFVPPPPPIFSWTGLYVGGQIGYAFGRDRAVIDTTAVGGGVLGIPGSIPYGASTSGVIGGGHIGYNLALPGYGLGIGSGLIVGVEGDFEGTDSSATSDVGAAVGNAVGLAVPPGLLTNRVRADIQGSVRGRLGVAVDRALFYATGGVAFAQFHSRYDANLAALGLPVSASIGDFSHTRTGYTVGGGVEYAITTNWSLRAEYRYSDFGTFTDAVGAGLVGGFAGIPVRHKETQQRVEVGFSYRFADPISAPIVARY